MTEDVKIYAYVHIIIIVFRRNTQGQCDARDITKKKKITFNVVTKFVQDGNLNRLWNTYELLSDRVKNRKKKHSISTILRRWKKK